MAWMWLSFCDPDLPEGTQFLGVAIVEGGNVLEGARKAHLLGINPGGEVMGLRFPDAITPPAEWCNRLLSRAEVAEADAAIGRLH